MGHGFGSAVRRGLARARRTALRRRHDDAGEIQGWVFVTLMTAGLVFAIWQVAEGRLVTLFEKAISSVTGG